MELVDEEAISKSANYSDDIFMETEGVIGYVDYEAYKRLQGSLEK